MISIHFNDHHVPSDKNVQYNLNLKLVYCFRSLFEGSLQTSMKKTKQNIMKWVI